MTLETTKKRNKLGRGEPKTKPSLFENREADPGCAVLELLRDPKLAIDSGAIRTFGRLRRCAAKKPPKLVALLGRGR